MCVHMKVLALTDRDLKLHMMNESAKDERFFLSDMCNFVVTGWIGNALVQCFNCELQDYYFHETKLYEHTKEFFDFCVMYLYLGCEQRLAIPRKTTSL